MLKKSMKITINDLNKASKRSRYLIYFFTIPVLGAYLIFGYNKVIMGGLVLSASGFILAILGYIWGIKLQYVSGNWRGSDSLWPSEGIKGVSAQIIGYILLLIGMGLFLFGLYRIFR